MIRLTEGNTLSAGTEILLDGFLVAMRLPTGVLVEVCKRCGGTGHYSFNLIDGTVCYGCGGRGIGEPTTEAEIIRKATNRAKARARREAKAAKEQAAAREALEQWQTENAKLIDALREHLDGNNSFLSDLAYQAIHARPLSERQIEAAWATLDREKEWATQKKQQQEAQAAAGYYSQVGAKITDTVTITLVRFIQSERYDRSSSYLVKMKTAEGHVLTTFSSGRFGREAEEGATVNIKGIVKSHTEYNGAPETHLTRVTRL